MFQSLALTCQRLVDRLFVKITIKKLISRYARLLVQQACNVFVSDILRKRIREFRAFPETLQELINSSFATVAATFGDLASAEVIHEMKSQHSFVIHNRTSRYNISPLREISYYIWQFSDRLICLWLTADYVTH